MTAEEWAEIPEHQPQQTALQWLEQAIQLDMEIMEIFSLIRQAKVMEKDKLIEAYHSGSADGSYGSYPDGEEYYNQTYGQ